LQHLFSHFICYLFLFNHNIKEISKTYLQIKSKVNPIRLLIKFNFITFNLTLVLLIYEMINYSEIFSVIILFVYLISFSLSIIIAIKFSSVLKTIFVNTKYSTKTIKFSLIIFIIGSIILVLIPLNIYSDNGYLSNYFLIIGNIILASYFSILQWEINLLFRSNGLEAKLRY
jgi:hypothetical protein